MSGPDRASDTLVAVAERAAAQARAENFPVALRLLPRAARSQLARVYRFARFVDDVGDTTEGDRLALLALVEADVVRLDAGSTPRLTPVAGLAPVIAAGVPMQPFLDLVAANVRDQHVTRYESFDALLGYCAVSAVPVGRIVLHLAERAGDERNRAESDCVCSALQVLEHCQDVREDARAGRVYLPAEDLRAAGVTDADLVSSTTSPALRSVVAAQVSRAEDLLRSGRPLVRRLGGWSRFAVAGYVAGGWATADALRKHDFDVLGQAIGPARPRVAGHALRLLAVRYA